MRPCLTKRKDEREKERGGREKEGLGEVRREKKSGGEKKDVSVLDFRTMTHFFFVTLPENKNFWLGEALS